MNNPYSDPIELPIMHHWMEKAACSGMFTELFFYTSGPGHTESDVEAGLAVCHSCPVMKQCLQFAFDTDDKYSVLGGTTPAQRRRMVKKAA